MPFESDRPKERSELYNLRVPEGYANGPRANGVEPSTRHTATDMLQMVGREADELRGAVEELRQRLAPVLQDNEPVDTEKRGSPPASSKFANEIAGTFTSLIGTRELVQRMIHQLDL